MPKQPSKLNADTNDRYNVARNLMDARDYSAAIDAFMESLESTVHFKTLELLGECYCRTGDEQKAIIYLAAATTLNKGVRAPSLLAELLAHQAEDHLRRTALLVAETALGRDAKNKRALAVKAALTSQPED